MKADGDHFHGIGPRIAAVALTASLSIFVAFLLTPAVWSTAHAQVSTRDKILSCFAHGSKTSAELFSCSGAWVPESHLTSCADPNGACLWGDRPLDSTSPAPATQRAPLTGERLRERLAGANRRNTLSGGSLLYTAPLFASPAIAQSCYDDFGPNRTKFADCMVKALVSPAQKEVYTCATNNLSATEAAKCVAHRQLTDSERALVDCLGAAGDNRIKQIRCMPSSPLSERDARFAECAANRGDAMACAGESYMTRRDANVVRCARENRGDAVGTAKCVGIGQLPEDQQQALGCAQESKGWMDFGLCMFAKDLTPEQRIGAQCAVESGGEPLVFVSCTGGRLTAREFEKCFTNGIGGDGGCFGKSNDLVKALDAIIGDLPAEIARSDFGKGLGQMKTLIEQGAPVSEINNISRFTAGALGTVASGTLGAAQQGVSQIFGTVTSGLGL